MKDVVLLCEVGVLLKSDDKEFESYNHVWNKQFGFFNENDILFREKDKKSAIEYAKNYVKNGTDMTYAIIGNEGECEWDENTNHGYKDGFDDSNLDIISGYYDMADVLYSVAKIDGYIVDNFLNEKVATKSVKENIYKDKSNSNEER